MEQSTKFSEARAITKRSYLKAFPPELYEAAKEIARVVAKHRLSVTELESTFTLTREITLCGADEDFISANDKLLLSPSDD